MPHTNLIYLLGNHPELLREIRHHIQHRRFQVVPLPDVAALRQQKSHEHAVFAVVVHELPHSNGPVLLRALREELPNVPVALFLGECKHELLNACNQARIEAFGQLPVSSEQLLAILEQCCPGYRLSIGPSRRSAKTKRVALGTTAALVTLSGAAQAIGPVTTGPDHLGQPNPTAFQQEAPLKMSLRFLGDFCVEFGTKNLEMPQKANSLLTYLVLYHHRAFTPDELAELFWPYNFRNDFSRIQARNSLKSEVSNIRRHLRELTGLPNEQFIDFNRKRKEYQWKPGLDWEADALTFVDTKTQIDGLKRGGSAVPADYYRKALQVYAGHFLRDFRHEVEEGGDWISYERDHLSCDFQELADAYADLLKEEERFGQVVSLCDEILQHDERRLKTWYLKLEALHKEEQFVAFEQAIRQFKRVIHHHFPDNGASTELTVLDQFLARLERSAA